MRWFGGFLIAWGMTWTVVSSVNPKGFAAWFYQTGKQYARIGQYHLGIWAFAKNERQFRFSLIMVSVLVVAIGLLMVS